MSYALGCGAMALPLHFHNHAICIYLCKFNVSVIFKMTCEKLPRIFQGYWLDLGNFCEISFLKYSSSNPQSLKECLKNGWGKGEEDFHISADSSLIPQFLNNSFAFLISMDGIPWGFLRKHGGVISTAGRHTATQHKYKFSLYIGVYTYL